MSEKLLPCPFCGQAAKYEYGEDWYDITCLCGYSFSHCDKQYPGESTKDAMIRSWNKRHYPPEITAVIDAAKKYAALFRYGCPPEEDDDQNLPREIYWAVRALEEMESKK
jgi:Lar family restriction alleviation protein